LVHIVRINLSSKQHMTNLLEENWQY